MSIPSVIPPMKPRTRERLYGTWAWASIILPTASVGLAAGGLVDPVPLLVANAVTQYLGSALGFTARAHVPDAPDAGE